MISNQKSGDGSINLQAGQNIQINQSIVLCSVEELSKALIASVFGELPAETKLKIAENQKSYFDCLSDALKELKGDQETIKKVVESPDFQYTSKMAGISASKTPSLELHLILAKLLADRVVHDGDELKKIAYNEAIKTVEKLTRNQLKILALSFIASRTKSQGLSTVPQFIVYIETRLKPFMDFKNTAAEFEHLAYASVASFSIASRNLAGIWQQEYKGIFPEGTDVKEALKESATAVRLFNLWEQTSLQHMSLTSVGIVVAISYYEKIMKEKIDVSIWIN